MTNHPELPVAGALPRLGACALSLLFSSSTASLLLLPTAKVITSTLAPFLGADRFPLLEAVALTAFFSFFLDVFAKRVFGLMIVDWNTHKPATFLTCALRRFVTVFSYVLLVGVIYDMYEFFWGKCASIGDLFLNTQVLSEEKYLSFCEDIKDFEDSSEPTQDELDNNVFYSGPALDESVEAAPAPSFCARGAYNSSDAAETTRRALEQLKATLKSQENLPKFSKSSRAALERFMQSDDVMSSHAKRH
eukprot:GILI01009475.1.p1 GENE.GILI01009475.1~~GILI01009475.1.p1  ORF type:complete len:248 (+),score=69.64 GILI01009475.1:128-871(+)